ncbi:MAG TPA: hypothetical protein VLB27_01245, partial [candidate division Zixibacteria bacterium]|nr:hypothetical protein [candidate division Zixibacteria bacterium]
KTTYEASEVHEVAAKAIECEAPAIQHVRNLLSFCEEGSEYIWSKCFPSVEIPIALRTSGLVIIKGFHGTSMNADKDIPVIEQQQFTDKARELNNRPRLIAWLYSRGFLPFLGGGVQSTHRAIEFGRFTIYWEACPVPTD